MSLFETAGSNATTLADGTVIGQIKIIVNDVDGGTSVCTVTDGLGHIALNFANDGDTATLLWTGTTGWAVLSSVAMAADSGIVDIA